MIATPMGAQATPMGAQKTQEKSKKVVQRGLGREVSGTKKGSQWEFPIDVAGISERR